MAAQPGGWSGAPRAQAWQIAALLLGLMNGPALAGPPFVSDDPEPTDYQHFEIYTFNNGTNTRDGTGGETGIDFNYGAAPDLQLTATLPGAFNQPAGGGSSLSDQSPVCRFVAKQSGIDYLQRHQTPETDVKRLIGNSHRTAAQL